MKIDLHAHTYFSDGSYSPTEVVNLAIQRGVDYLAICDHDVISGVKEAQTAARGKKIKVLAGTEITCRVDCSDKEAHIVGLYVDLHNPLLKSFSENIQKFKIEKTKKKIDFLNKNLNLKIALDDVRNKTKGVPSSAHIWMVLVDLGIAKDIKEGRELTIKHGSIPEDKAEKRIHARDAIKMIHDSGGLAILAHLAAYKKENKFVSFSEQEELIRELLVYELDGLEIYIPDVTDEELKFGEQMAKKYNLRLSCGSDFHNEKFIPQNKLGFLEIEKNQITILRN